jgi:tetratricopeptide (TPR) repeat protein
MTIHILLHRPRSSECFVQLSRLFVALVTAAILCKPAPSAAESSTAEPGSVVCGDPSSLPVGSLGSDKEQRRLVFKQAMACVRERKPRRAITLFSALIKADPRDAEAYLNRGSVQATLGEKVLAMSDYNTAISLQPDQFESWYNRGTALTRWRQYERAIADFAEAIRLKPDFALAYCNRGFAYFELGRYDEALADYTRALELDAGNLTYCYFSRGTFYLTTGEYQKAITDFTEGLRQKPSDAIGLSRRGQAYEGLGKHSQALEDFSAALRLDPKLESAREGVERLSEEQKRLGGSD